MKRALFVLLFIMSSCSPTFRHLVKNDIAIRQTKNLQFLKSYQIVRIWENTLFISSFPLLKSAAPYADSTIYSGGFVLYDSVVVAGYTGVKKLSDDKAYDLKEQAKVQFVHPQFPAYAAGLREEDEIVSVDGQDVRGFSAKELMGKITESGKYGRIVYLEIKRNGHLHALQYVGDSIAAYEVRLLYTNNPVCLANGSSVLVSKGYLDALKSQEEVNYFMSYQIAKNLLNQLWKQTGQITAGAVADLLALYATGIPTLGAFGKVSEGFYAKEFVYDADVLSLYLLHESGGNIEGAPDFWYNLDKKYSQKEVVDLLYFPPTPQERYQELKKSVEKIHYHFQG